MEIYSEPWFRTRLDYYLRERHPQLQYRAQLLDRRSAVAADLYRRTCDAGGSAECALRLADRSLFRGLLFSKFDTIDLILANDFPDIPEDQRRTVARALLTPCEPIFAGYALGDDFASRPEFRSCASASGSGSTTTALRAMKPSSATVYARGRCGTASREKRTEINNDPLILYSIMKKTFVAALAALALVSCSKEETVTYGTNGEPLDGAAVCLTFTDAPASRASLTAAAETWEKSLTSLTVYVFNSQGNLVTQRSFTSEELADKSATFALPHSAAGTTCDFYAVANLSLTGVTTKSALLSKVEASAADYNGTFAEVSTKAKRAGGFVMSASASKSIAEGSTTDVAMALRRTVAKLSVQTTIDAAFAEKYSGTITVTGVKLSKAASQSPVIAPATPSPGAMSYTHTQTATAAAGRYDNLFYVFENGALAEGNRVQLEITASYDADGSTSTTSDRTEIVYTVPVTGKAGGAIVRNGYYRIEAAITGLVGSEVGLTITVADWESPVTQQIDLGA